MALPRYKPSEVRLDTGAGIAEQAQASEAQNLANIMSQWQGVAGKELGEQRANEAQEQAYKDTIDGKPFHKENVYTIYGQAYNTTRKATYSAQLEMDISNKSAELAELHKDNPNAYNSAMQGFMKGIEKETPDSAIKASLAITGGKLISKQTDALTVKHNKATKDTQLATYEVHRNKTNSDIINAALSDDTKTVDLLKAKRETYIRTLRDTGVITEAKMIEDLADNNYTINRGIITQGIQQLVDEKDWEAAEKIITKFDKKIPDGYSYDQWQKTSNALNNAYARGKKLESYDTKKVTTTANKSVKDKTDRIKQGVNDGSEVVSKEDLALADADVREDYETESKWATYSKSLAPYSLLELEATSTKIKADTKLSEQDIKVQKKFDAYIKEVRAGYKKDAISQGEKLGNYEPTNPITLDMPDDEFIAGMNERFNQRGINVSNAGNEAGDMLKPDEAVAMKDYLESADQTTQLQVLNKISSLPKEQSEVIYKQLDKKGAYVYSAAGTLLQQGQTKVAQAILTGNIPGLEVATEKSFSGTTFTKLLGLIGEHSVESRNDKTKVVEMYHKGMLAEDKLTSVTEAVEAIYGKINDYSGREFFMPVGVGKTDFDTWIDKYELKGEPKLTEEIRGMNDTFWDSDLQLVYKDDGKYYIKDSSTGQYQTDADKKLIVMDYYDMPDTHNRSRQFDKKFGDFQ